MFLEPGILQNVLKLITNFNWNQFMLATESVQKLQETGWFSPSIGIKPVFNDANLINHFECRSYQS